MKTRNGWWPPPDTPVGWFILVGGHPLRLSEYLPLKYHDFNVFASAGDKEPALIGRLAPVPLCQAGGRPEKLRGPGGR